MEWFWADIAARLIGTSGGVVIAFAMSNDARTWNGLARRLLVSVVFGFLLAEPVAHRLGMPFFYGKPWEIVAGSCISAALGWWLMHAIIRLVQLWNRKAESVAGGGSPVEMPRPDRPWGSGEARR